MRFSLLLALPIAAVLAAPAHAAPLRPDGSYGGDTKQDWPVVLQVAKHGRSIRAAHIALDRTCTSGDSFVSSDTYHDVNVSRSGAFSVSFGPEPQQNDDGTVTNFSGTLKGRVDKRRGRITGTWQLVSVDSDTAGTTTDTCDSGVVSFSASQ
jgi:hypothetical protein